MCRFSHSSHISGDSLILIGGVNDQQYTPGIGVVNLCSGVAQEFSLPVNIVPLFYYYLSFCN